MKSVRAAMTVATAVLLHRQPTVMADSPATRTPRSPRTADLVAPSLERRMQPDLSGVWEVVGDTVCDRRARSVEICLQHRADMRGRSLSAVGESSAR